MHRFLSPGGAYGTESLIRTGPWQVATVLVVENEPVISSPRSSHECLAAVQGVIRQLPMAT